MTPVPNTMSRPRVARVWPAAALALLATVAACTKDATGGTSLTVSCPAGDTLPVLAVGAYTSLDVTATSGCLRLAANPSLTDSAQYLVVLQSAGGVPGDSAAFRLRGSGVTAAVASIAAPAPAAAARAAAATPRGSRTPVAAGFDRFLRSTVRHVSAPAVAAARERLALASRAPTSGPPVVGSLRSFQVCGDLNCSTFKTVTAAARSVGAHVAIYVDTLAPSPGLGTADLDTLQRIFDTNVFPVDTAAFGSETDLDGNSVVIALLTGTVNALVTTSACVNQGFVQGFFYPPDLLPGQFANSNGGEIFYAIVPDPSGTLSCAHTVAEIKTDLPPTFNHEFEHMINFSQHVLVHGGDAEDTWLDEGLAHYAEELGGRSFLPADSASFSYFAIGDVYNAFQYLQAPETHALLAPGDQDLADDGAGWLYVRYLVDRFGAGIAGQLVQTSMTGTANVASQTGLPFATTFARWALANWVSDLPGFVPPAELTYTTWHFRHTYASLHSQDPFDFPLAFPLRPASTATSAGFVSGYLRAGSAAYLLVPQGPGSPGDLITFGSGSFALPSRLVPRLTVLRIR